MKKNVLMTALLFCLSSSAFANDILSGGMLGMSKATGNDTTDTSYAFSALVSSRAAEMYGYEMQAGIFGGAGEFSKSAFFDLSVAIFIPLGDSAIQPYIKAGVADVYAMSGTSSNHVGMTYGAGIEYRRNKGAVRLGFQHYDVGNAGNLSTNLIGLTFLSD